MDRSAQNRALASGATAIPNIKIPAIEELADLDQWVARDAQKKPIQANGSGASVSDPATWSSFDSCCGAAEALGLAGVGFVFRPEDDYTGIDLDHVLDESGCIRDPSVAKWVQELSSYTEVSPSGDGLHIIVRGTIPHAAVAAPFEIYSQGRYFTMTGQHYPGTPETIEPCGEALTRLHRAILEEKRKGKKADQGSSSESVGEGSRHPFIVQQATTLQRRGLKGSALFWAITGLNETRCTPPLPVEEVRDIFEWADRLESHDTRFEHGPNPEAPPTTRLWPYFFGGDADGSLEHQFVVEDLIHEASVAMIYGRQGCLKTQLAFDIAAHVGAGAPYRGLATTPGITIYVAAEGAGAIGKRVAGVYLEHPGLPKDAIVCVPQPVNLASEDDARSFADFVVETILPALSMPVRLLVYDTLSKSMPGRSDSDDESIGLVEANVRLIARQIAEVSEEQFTPAAAIVHHPRKNDEVFRGSGAIEGDLDTIIHVSRGDAETLEDRLCEVELQKVKDGPTDRSWAYRGALVHVGTTPRGKDNYAPVVRYLDDDERVSAKAESKSKGRRLTANQRHMIELIVRLEERDGRKHVPTPFLEESGYAARMEDFGGLNEMPVNGVMLADLQQLFYSEEGECTRTADGKWTISEAGRKRWERRRDSLINAGHAWACSGWIWLTPEPTRTVPDGD